MSSKHTALQLSEGYCSFHGESFKGWGDEKELWPSHLSVVNFPLCSRHAFWELVCVLLIAWPSWIIKMEFCTRKMLINLSSTAYFEMAVFKDANCCRFVEQNGIIIAERIEMLTVTQGHASKSVLAFYGRVLFLWVADILPCVYLWIGEHTRTKEKKKPKKSFFRHFFAPIRKNNLS